jgi:hypothetical protein
MDEMALASKPRTLGDASQWARRARLHLHGTFVVGLRTGASAR